jgi:hypothetical protein
MKKFLQSLLSRKLWLAIGAFITFVANGQYTEAMGIAIAYFGATVVDNYTYKD